MRRREIQLNHEKQDRIQESAESMQTSEGSIQESTESVQSSQEDMEMCTESIHESAESIHGSTESIQGSTGSIQGSTESIQGSTESIQESTGDIQERPMYTLIRVNRYLEPVSGAVPLQDEGVYEVLNIYLFIYTFLKDGIAAQSTPIFRCHFNPLFLLLHVRQRNYKLILQ